MAQVGLHALTGLVVGEKLLGRATRTRTGRRALLFGFVLGNILPDLDYLAVVGAWPVNHTLALHLHRGFSHSLLAGFALLVGFFVAAWLMGDSYLRYMGSGLAMGVAAHFTLDIFIWFAPVDIFWPASAFGVIPPVNLWSWFQTPPLLGRLLGAFEFGAFGLYYDHLARLAAAFKTNLDQVNSLTRMANVGWFTWAIVSALSVDLVDDRFAIYLYVLMGIVFMPACLYLTWRMQDTIEQLGLLSSPGIPLEDE